MDIAKLFFDENEKPLDRMPADGGYASIFRTIACIGDSLAAGEFETEEEDGATLYHDYYEYSWGQYLARMLGSTVYNMSRGGMTAREYMQSFGAKQGFFRKKYASQAYLVALGVNDLLNENHPFGSLHDLDAADWRKNKDTFAGNFGKIISAYREIEPDSVFLLVTMPRAVKSESAEAIKDRHRELMYDFADRFRNTYVIDLRKYAPVYDDLFRKLFYYYGHMSPAGYRFTAEMIASYMDFIVRHNMEAFKGIGLV